MLEDERRHVKNNVRKQCLPKTMFEGRLLPTIKLYAYASLIQLSKALLRGLFFFYIKYTVLLQLSNYCWDTQEHDTLPAWQEAPYESPTARGPNVLTMHRKGTPFDYISFVSPTPTDGAKCTD